MKKKTFNRCYAIVHSMVFPIYPKSNKTFLFGQEIPSKSTREKPVLNNRGKPRGEAHVKIKTKIKAIFIKTLYMSPVFPVSHTVITVNIGH